MKTILIPQDVAEEGKEYLQDYGYRIKMGSGTDRASLLIDVQEVDAILFRNETYDAEVLNNAHHVQVMGRHGVGVDKVDLETAENLGIWVTNGPHSNTHAVAELTIGFIIALGRNLLASNQAMHMGDYDYRNRMISHSIEGKTLALLGFGKIGKLVAHKAHFGLGMHVVAYDSCKTREFPDYVHRLESSHEAFQIGDFVSIHYPANKENNHSVSIRELSLMKRSAYFLNLARGELVIEEDLIAALETHLIAGAGLDVFAKEPPDADNPLLKMDQVLLTPHNAALTTDCMVKMALDAARGIHEVLSGNEPSWPVNRPVKPRNRR